MSDEVHGRISFLLPGFLGTSCPEMQSWGADNGGVDIWIAEWTLWKHTRSMSSLPDLDQPLVESWCSEPRMIGSLDGNS
ncbi:hypothetical protein A6R68_03157, partial [Neotoma lepida]